MSTPAQRAATGIAAVFAACAIATPLVVKNEGWLTKTYADPVGIPTACAGVTGAGVVKGKTYTPEECEIMTSDAVLKHALALRPCLPANLSPETGAAFISFGYNIGVGKFCGSGVSHKARAGDLPGACADLSKWIYAGGKVLPGLVTRRAEERALCERGLK